MKKSGKKRPVGRPSTGLRKPVLAFRVHPQIYDELWQAAARAGLSISEEAERRLQVVPMWERQFGDTKKLREQTLESIAADFKAALFGAGYQPFSTSRGRLWAEPGVDLLSGPLSIEVEIAAAIQQATPKIVQAITSELVAQAKKEGTSPEKNN